MLTPEQLDEAREIFRREEAKKRVEKKLAFEAAQAIKAKMTVEEKIEFVNTPYDEMQEELKPGMTKNPQMFNYVRINQPNLGGQKETFAARVIRFRDKYNLSREDFRNICNVYAQKLDLPAKGKRRKQKVRITKRDMLNYEDRNVTPKSDKQKIIQKAFGMTEDFFAGYGEQDRICPNQIIEARFRKKKNKKTYKVYDWETMPKAV